MGERTILYIAPDLPYPLDGGLRIRQFHILSAYAKVGRVRLAFFYHNEDELAGIEKLKSICTSFHPVAFHTMHGEAEFPKLSSWRRQLGEVLTPKPAGVRYCFSREMEEVIEEIAPSSDLIHVGRLSRVAPVERVLKNKSNGQRFVLDLDDVETVRNRREIRAYPMRWQTKAFRYLDLLRLWRYQRKMLRMFDRVFVCSEQDRAHLGNGKVTVIPNGASVPPRLLPDESEGKTLIYIATLSYRPNVDSLYFFVKQILPLIESEVPGVRLLIVGTNPPHEVTLLHDARKIWVESNVPSVEQYYRQATISVVPLTVAAGTRLKILEAFALGRPVVSTSVGCEGLDVVNGKHLCIADDPGNFAKSCINLLRNNQLRERLVLHGRKLVEQNYRWDSIQNHVENLTRDLLEGRSN